ncbi:MAG: hypothetical protein M1827_006680 [Pycnora praestabilis]|nr:MAG: hypothetical protein M1827_006680 [Pycnora praestabilis]
MPKEEGQASWETIAAHKQAERLSRIPKEWLLHSLPADPTTNVLDVPRKSGILDEKELYITDNFDATLLAHAIAVGKLRSVDVVRAFCKTNCLTEIFFDAAIQRAEYLDSHLKITGKPLGPLHGVPISLKDTFNITGYDSSIGIASLAFNPATENALLAQVLLDAGAVLYCKTNIPQTLMSLDSENNLFGRTLNPANRLATAGGSSGGEGALIAMRGSVLGVGTDVGGSVRIPAMCNGLYGIKPSAQRVPYVGQEGGALLGASMIGLPASAGPIAGSLRDCEMLMRVVGEARPWERDPSVVPGRWDLLDDLGFQGEEPERRTVIGIVRTDGLATPLPPITKVLEEVVRALRKTSTVDVVEMDITPLFKQCQSLTNAFFGIDGNNHILSLLEKTGEPLVTWLAPRLKRKKGKSTDEVRELHARKMELETQFLKVWRDSEGRRIDAFVCPVAPHPVPPIDRWNGVGYTSSFVLLDYPAGVRR